MSKVLDEALLGGLILWFYEAYCDETGDDGGFPILAVGGYLIEARKARMLEAKWKAALERYKLPYFHMVEMAHGKGVFKNMDRESIFKIQKELFKLINDHIEISFACAVPLHRFSKDVNDGQQPYTLCLNHSLLLAMSLLERKHQGSFKLSVYYEAGHKHASQAKRRFDAIKFTGERPRFEFIKKKDSGEVQAADALIWQYSKFIKDLVNHKQGARKDFQQLMKKPAAFLNVIPDEEAFGMMMIYDDHLNGINQTAQHIAGVQHDLTKIREFFAQDLSFREIFGQS